MKRNISLTSGYETQSRLNSDQKTLQNNQKTALIIINIIILKKRERERIPRKVQSLKAHYN